MMELFVVRIKFGTFLNSLLLLKKRHMFHPKLTDHTTSFMNVNSVVISHGHSYQLLLGPSFSTHRLSTVRELVGSS